MRLDSVLEKRNITKYRLAKISGVPYATINDLCNGKTDILKSSAETLYRISKALQVPMEDLLAEPMAQLEMENSYEIGLPPYLQNDLDAYKEGLKNHSSLLDCLWGELYGSINIAEINEGVITPEHANYLRQKYLWR